MLKFFWNMLAAVTVASMLAACESGEPEPIAEVRRTILVYMEARNSLGAAGNSASDLEEMGLARIPSDCRLLVYRSESSGAPALVEVKGGRQKTLKTYPAEASAVDPEQMMTVLADVKQLAPADDYGLIMWSHSSGWQQTSRRSRGFGLEDSARTMSVSDLASALAVIDWEFIYFDTCYMACVEVAYELRHAAHYLVGSVCEVPADGMAYDQTLPFLFSAGTVEGLRRAIDITADGYLSLSNSLCPVTLSLIDLSRLDNLALTVKQNQKPLPVGYSPQRFSTSSPYRYLFFDLGQYMEAIGADMEALDLAVIHERHSPLIWGVLPMNHCSGLSVYLPELSGSGYDYSSYGYDTLDWYRFLNS